MQAVNTYYSGDYSEAVSLFRKIQKIDSAYRKMQVERFIRIAETRLGLPDKKDEEQKEKDVVAEENQKRDKKEAENKSGGKEISSNAVSVAKKTTETTTTRPNVSKKEISVALTPDCKYCNAQLFVLEAFKKKYPFLDMKIVWFGEKDKVPSTTIPVFLGREEDKKKIRKFPTFFFTLTNGEVVAGEGFVDGKNLELFCKKVGVL